jgi:hypothetical protein
LKMSTAALTSHFYFFVVRKRDHFSDVVFSVSTIHDRMFDSQGIL